MRKLSKVLVIMLLQLCVSSFTFAAGGIMHKEGKVKMVQTKWFDIIYGEVAEDSASVLYANADQIYQDLADMYGWEEPPCRMPVVLTTQVEVFNAYFGTGNYNHIVLYVTNPIEELENQPDVFLWTFRHELTHAFTYNMKGKMTNAWTKVFGDSSTFQAFTVTPGVAEGATVSSESYNGNGRLNDEFAKQYVKQAKIEDKFPEYNDVQGSRDIYPAGSYYYFNGAFHAYLQEKYGLEKYAQFWYNCINNSILTSRAFKKAYGTKLKKEWDKFVASYKVPQIPGNPLDTGSVQDFFNSSKEDYSSENKKGALFSHLSASEKGITYIDEKNNTVFFVSKNNLENEDANPEALFQYFYIDSATQSVDGKYITVTYYDTSDENYRYHVAVYDTETKKWYKPEYQGVKEGIVVKQGSDYYLSVLSFKGEKSEVKITKLIKNSEEIITGEEEPVFYSFARNQLASSFVPVKDGVFAYLLNTSLNYSIQLMDVNGKLLADYKAPSSSDLSHFIMHYLSVNSKNPDELYFSWVSKDTMPRVGKLNLADAEYTLSLEDLSGGIFYPVKYNDVLIYEGEFLEYNKLFKKTSEFNVKDEYVAEFSNFSDSKDEFVLFDEENNLAPIPSVSEVATVNAYNPFKYLKRGTFLPISELNSVSYDSVHSGSYSLPLGFTYMTNNPWDSTTYTLSAGYGSQTNSGAIALTVSESTDTQSFSWGTTLFSEFDSKGWKAANLEGNIGISKDVTNLLVLEIRPSAIFHAGRSNADAAYVHALENPQYSLGLLESAVNFGAYGNHDDLFYLYTAAQTIIALGNQRTVLDNRFGRKGFLAGLLPLYRFSYDVTNSAVDYGYGDVSFFGKVQLPRIIPVDCEYGKTYNLPVKFVASAFSTSMINSNLISIPSNTNIPYPNLAMVGSEMVLYAQEFQQSFAFMYIHDFYLSAVGILGFDYVSHAYDSFGIRYTPDFVREIADGTNKPMAILSLKASLGLNVLNLGVLARSGMKNYICIMPAVVFENFSETPKIQIIGGADIRF